MNRKRFLKPAVLLLAMASFGHSVRAQESEEKAPPTLPSLADRLGRSEPKPYNKVITDKAVSDAGVFTIHKVDEKYYFEIPDSLLGREMLLVSRVAKTANGLGFGGEKLNEKMLRWQRLGNKVYLRLPSYNNVVTATAEMATAVQSSNVEPIYAAFDIKAFGKDSASVVIDATELCNKDLLSFGLGESVKKQFKITMQDESKSYINAVKSFPLNVEIRSTKTYKADNSVKGASGGGTVTLEINNSLVLLPKEPMRPRLADNRVGYFNQSQVDYGLNEQKAEHTWYISRWRLEPKDMAAFKRGELVEPVKPIIYYIDPATPKKWVPYLKQGVEDWRAAFEAAGFKNAIFCKDAPAPAEDPEWSTEDARYSVIRYFASETKNAYGPHVADPRSGEILETHIGWYHNVMVLIHDWFLVQTGAVNADARSMQLKDEVMGQLIRFVSSHEVGHTLGLMHNFGASNAYPVDSLRSARFTQEYGTAPSIMDYARFNYIAQPQDKGVYLYPKIGPYDKHAIAWGYRPLPDAQTPQDEVPTLNKWLVQKAGNKMYLYGRQTLGTATDPRSQSEDLGDDAMKASAYGISNLKIVMANLEKWVYGEGKEYEDLQEMYSAVLAQWNRYMGHVASNVGGLYETFKSMDQKGAVYEPVPAPMQRKAVQFLLDNAFTTQPWLSDRKLLDKFSGFGNVDKIRNMQVSLLDKLVGKTALLHLAESETLAGEHYTIMELLADLRKGLFEEYYKGSKPDIYRRGLQRGYLDALGKLLVDKEAGASTGNPLLDMLQMISQLTGNINQTDVRPLVRAELSQLKKDMEAGKTAYTDAFSKANLQDLVYRINKMLKPD
jgi:hypothetical protein